MKKLAFLLKSTLKFCGIFAFAVVIGFSIASCNKETGSPLNPKAYEKFSKARFVPELHEVLPEVAVNSIQPASKSNVKYVKSSTEEVMELNVTDLGGSYNFNRHSEPLINSFDGVREMINFIKKELVQHLVDSLPDHKSNTWIFVKDFSWYPKDYIKWHFSESNGQMKILEETRRSSAYDDLRRRKITLHADGEAEMYESFICYATSINYMMYSYCKDNDFIFYSVDPEFSQISYMAFSEVDGSKTGKHVSSLFNSQIQISSLEGNNTKLFFYNYNGSVYAADDVFRSESNVTIMKDGNAIMLIDGERRKKLFELYIDIQVINEIEKLYCNNHEEWWGICYEPVRMLLKDGTELSISGQPFLIDRAIEWVYGGNWGKRTGPLIATIQLGSN